MAARNAPFQLDSVTFELEASLEGGATESSAIRTKLQSRLVIHTTCTPHANTGKKCL
jgi:hypothetical protein